MADGPMTGAGAQNVWRVMIKYKVKDTLCQTGFKLRDVAVNDNDAGEVADAVTPWVHNSFRTLLATADEITAIDVFRIGGEEGIERILTGEFGTSGLPDTTQVPTFLAANVAFKTSRRKRYGQGRVFWPVRNENWVDNDKFNATAIGAYQGAIDALLTAFTGSTVTHDLLLVNSHGILPPRAATATTPARPEIPATWYDVETVKLNTVVTYLRSRKLGIGQ